MPVLAHPGPSAPPAPAVRLEIPDALQAVLESLVVDGAAG